MALLILKEVKCTCGPCGQLGQASIELGGRGPWAFPVPSAGAEAFWLVAQDQENDELQYGISGSNAYFFNVISHTGEVKLASPLDYEVKENSLGRPCEGQGGGQGPGGHPSRAHLGACLSAHCRRSTGSPSPSP